jgi:hypothetical protein
MSRSCKRWNYDDVGGQLDCAEWDSAPAAPRMPSGKLVVTSAGTAARLREFFGARGNQYLKKCRNGAPPCRQGYKASVSKVNGRVCCIKIERAAPKRKAAKRSKATKRTRRTTRRR